MDADYLPLLQYSLNGLPLSILALADATTTQLLHLGMTTVEQLARITLLTPIVIRDDLTKVIELDLRNRLGSHTVYCYVQAVDQTGVRPALVIESDFFRFVASVLPGGNQECTCTYAWMNQKFEGGVPFHAPGRKPTSRRRGKTLKDTASVFVVQNELPLFEPPPALQSQVDPMPRPEILPIISPLNQTNGHASPLIGSQSEQTYTPLFNGNDTGSLPPETAPPAHTTAEEGACAEFTDPHSDVASLYTTLNRLLLNLEERERIVLTLRYGLDKSDGRTLEAIGQQFGITRERVRQIEKKAIRKLLQPRLHQHMQPFVTQLNQALAQAGGIMSLLAADNVFCNSSQDRQKNSGLVTEFMLNFASDIEKVKKTPVIIDKQLSSAYQSHINPTFTLLKHILKQAAAPLPANELLFRFATDEQGRKINEQVPEDFLVACFQAHPDVAIDEEGYIGLASWARTRVDDIIVVLRTHGKPLHYSEITDRVNQRLPDDQQTTAHNIHAQIGRLTGIFVRVGHGIFGLAEWGLTQDSCVADAAHRVLSEAGTVLDIEEITTRVLKTWHVKPTSVRAAIDLDKRVVRVAPNRYVLAHLREMEPTSAYTHGKGIQVNSFLHNDQVDKDNASAHLDTDENHTHADDCTDEDGTPNIAPRTPIRTVTSPRRARVRRSRSGVSTQRDVESVTRPRDAYDEWNQALIDYAITGKQRGTTVFLSIDDDIIVQIAGQGSEPDSKPREDFFEAIRRRVVRGKRIHLASIHGRYASGEPVGVAFLAAMVIAASRMAEEEDDDGEEARASNDYFTRLREVLKIPGHGRPQGMKAGAEEPLWREWSQWLVEQGFLPSAKSRGEGSTKFISYPISQALLRGADKDRLRRLFDEKDWPEDWDAETLIVYVQREAPYLTKHLQKLLSSEHERFQAVTEAIYEVYEDWESGAYTSRRQTGQSVNRHLLAGLIRSENVITGNVTYRLYPRQAAKRQVNRIQVVLPAGSAALSRERPGWYTPTSTYQITEQDLEQGVRFDIEYPTNLDKLLLPARQFWVLIPDPEDLESGAYASWGSPPLGTPFMLLCRRELLPQLEHLREERLIEWQDDPQDLFGAGNWIEINQCMVISESWGGVQIENQDLHDRLRPNESVYISLSGGLRAPDTSGWMEGYGPEITVFGFQSNVYLMITHQSNQRCLLEQEQPTNCPFAVEWPGAGDYLIEVTGTNENPHRRLVSIVPWEKIHKMDFNQIEGTNINGKRVCGALIEE